MARQRIMMDLKTQPIWSLNNMRVKSTIKKLIPEGAISFYHYCLAWLAAFYSGFPSKKLATIGIVGTKGKTSTANFIWSCLKQAGFKTGMLSTANIRIGQEEFLNKYHMTMPGPFIVQGYLKKMLKSGCSFAIIEATSEGIKQWRHKGIYFDFLVFTNLSPEHLPSHKNSFEKYKETKGKVFNGLTNYPHKRLAGRDLKKTIIVNADDANSQYFLNFKAERKLTFGIKKLADYQAINLQTNEKGTTFFVKSKPYQMNVIGQFNVYNALPAIAICDLLGIDYGKIENGLADLKILPGRMEVINQGQDFTVLVDYAHEPKSMELALSASRKLVKSGGRLIVLLGAEGGGRDKTKRPKMGELAGKLADIVVVSNVDPYDDNPLEIIEDIAKKAEQAGKIRSQNLFAIEDRREGIKKCLYLAQAGSVVLITGKGAEQSMIIAEKNIPWDDREVVKDELKGYRRININNQ
ncbi:MAG: UDP-N-acetylmuramoyl-L-alanyl-D-glutamate--2,6-diaminopimelate ligase [Candidatus Pacebacteria bacterium]|nr:UDP-N-acetylmuramoyl-L-alanyl-D-glutamate--2,6-diaminopimelate ligase [Candidatus Paceibacterota bacterium]